MENIYLREFQGVKYRTMLVREDASVSPGPLKRAELVYQYIRSGLENRDQECFVSILFNSQMVPLGVSLVSVGRLNCATVEPREVFKTAIIASAASLIVAHNHPSGDCKPSQDDIHITTSLKEAGDMLQIPILDHIIVGRDCFYSMKEHEEI